MTSYFSEGMTEDDEVFGDATKVAAEVLNKCVIRKELSVPS